ncbi:MAG: metalloregulator ArsR/SmtB family transcription factor [Treponemataceae bacterium]|nr:metalloregulator ArsR/SmtB family transcription factor [Treponemataceae bacterium]
MQSQTESSCSCSEVDVTTLEKIRSAQWTVPKLLGLSEIFKVLSDPGRLRILNALMVHKQLCVCDLAALLEVSQSALSHQLAILRRARLVRPAREGKVVYYQLDDHHVDVLVSVALEHISEQGIV